MAMNDNEKNAVAEKLDFPERIVRCPRCGAELKYYEYGNSSKAYCPNDEDIKGTIRGI